jgi:phage tail sheath protein FI
MPGIVAPGVYIEEIGGGPPPISAAPTAVTAFVGWAPAGPAGTPVAVRGLPDFEKSFGQLDARGWLGYALRHFFDNGGAHALVVRIDAADGAALLPGTPEFHAALLPARGKGGVHALEEAGGFNLLCVPGEATPAVLAELTGFCAANRAFLIADCDPAAAPGALTAGPDPVLTGPHGRDGALYFPWILAVDPLTGQPRAFPPSGFVAGIYARIDSSRGVWKAPAGSDATVIGALDAAQPLTDAQQGPLNRNAINCIRKRPGGVAIWGARTLAGGGSTPSDWRYVPVRRLALFIEQSIARGTEWAVFEPNAEPLWLRLRSASGSFLMALFQQGAFQGATPEDAFFVKCDATTTTQADIDRGTVNLLVGFAPLRPAQFVVLRFGLKAGQKRA